MSKSRARRAGRGRSISARTRTHTTSGVIDETLLGIRHDRVVEVRPHCPKCGRVWRKKGSVTHVCGMCIKYPNRKVVIRDRLEGFIPEGEE